MLIVARKIATFQDGGQTFEFIEKGYEKCIKDNHVKISKSQTE